MHENPASLIKNLRMKFYSKLKIDERLVVANAKEQDGGSVGNPLIHSVFLNSQRLLNVIVKL